MLQHIRNGDSKKCSFLDHPRTSHSDVSTIHNQLHVIFQYQNILMLTYLPSCPENTVPTYTLLVQEKMPKSHKHQITNQKRNVLFLIIQEHRTQMYQPFIISYMLYSSTKTF
ncbi:hypothetical protein GUJ93_ZPchr0014g46976 [Zizania palustris]|uniref:Uncharacterized protein n=1 Tax=Zizania palustris TaxID=103762 RepID=A0A8J5VV82_ZIZPA|nr:hypothetical protein GUJ93_ZPchr0014g46976 [Zizania palustris]